MKQTTRTNDKEEDLPGEMFSSEELLREETNENMSFFEQPQMLKSQMIVENYVNKEEKQLVFN